MKRKGRKMSVLCLTAIVAAAVVMVQMGTAAAGAPDVCEEPCDEEARTAQLPVEVQEAEPGLSESVETEVEHTGAPVPAESRLLPVRTRVPPPRGGVAEARGGLGYRVPLVVKQQVPARIRGGVYMPAHETYVVLRPGYWELEGAAEDPGAAAFVEPTGEPEAASGCWLRRLFRKLGRCDGGP